MVSMMDRGPQRTEFSQAQNKGGGGNRSQTHMARVPRKGGFISGKSFFCFFLFGLHKKPDIFGFFKCYF